MLKKGFTLQELLISLTVIGVVSAVALPSLMSIQPDKSKTIYMKVYNTLTTQTGEIMDDSRLPFLIIETTFWHLEELQVSCTLVLNFVTLLFCSYLFFPVSKKYFN